MTRFARRGTIVSKKPHEASSWSELKRGWKVTGKSCQTQRHNQDECKSANNMDPSKSKTSEVGPAIKKDTTQKGYLEQKRERRRMEKQLKRFRLKEKSQKCGFCGEQGHAASGCSRRVTETVFGACRQCGSTDHIGENCKKQETIFDPSSKLCKGEDNEEADCPSDDDDDNDVSSQRCPLCHERGHQVKGCPDNPRSIYPRGGSCKDCGSVEHKTKLCPTRQSIQDLEEVKVGTVSFGSNESADAFEEESQMRHNNVKMKTKKNKTKIVIF